MSELDELWIDASEIVRLFPTFVWKRRLRPDVHRPIDAAIHRRLDELECGPPPPEQGRGWQSGHDLHRLEAFRGLVSCVGVAVDEVLTFLRIEARNAAITGCWANVNAPGAAHAMHTHPNNFLSGVYYVQVPEGADTINFHDPRPQVGVVRPPVTGLTAYNTDQVVIKVEPGMLLVFPAWLAHSVDANRSGFPRISISFNVMFAAFAESMAQPLWGDE